MENSRRKLLQHDMEAPAVCQALSITPVNEDNPFQAVRYVNGPVSAAWQMLHTAHLVLTLFQPVPRAARLALLSSSEVKQKALLFVTKTVGQCGPATDSSRAMSGGAEGTTSMLGSAG
jgi:hypothetical protein